MNVAILGALALLGIFAVSKSTSDQVATPDTSEVPVTPEEKTPWTKFDDLFHSKGDEYGVDWTWLKAFSLNESNLGRERSVANGMANPSDVDGSKSSDGKSWGLMQVTLTTARQYDSSASAEKLNNPDYSVDLAAQLISDLQSQFSRNDPRFTEWVVKSYNQGAGNTKKEMAGIGGGYANPYWDRWQRNLTQVEENPA
jgi:hypothetical protein